MDSAKRSEKIISATFGKTYIGSHRGRFACYFTIWICIAVVTSPSIHWYTEYTGTYMRMIIQARSE